MKKSKYRVIALKDHRMAIEHKDKFAYFGPMPNANASVRFERLINRLDSFCFENKRHESADEAESFYYDLDYDAF